MEANERGKKPRKCKVLELRITTERLVCECITCGILFISCLSIAFGGTIDFNTRWTLLTLSAATVTTIIQFHQEGQWVYRDKWCFSLPVYVFSIIALLLATSFITPSLVPFFESRIVVVAYSMTLAVRQGLYVKLIWDIFNENVVEDGGKK